MTDNEKTISFNDLKPGCDHVHSTILSVFDSQLAQEQSRLQRDCVRYFELQEELRDPHANPKFDAESDEVLEVIHRTMASIHSLKNVKSLFYTWDGSTIRRFIADLLPQVPKA